MLVLLKLTTDVLARFSPVRTMLLLGVPDVFIEIISGLVYVNPE